MNENEKKTYVILGHNDLDYLEEIRKHILQREGIVSVDLGRLPAVYSFQPLRPSTFSIQVPVLTPMCDHALVLVCDDAVTLIGDIMAAVEGIRTDRPDDGIIFAVQEQCVEQLKKLGEGEEETKPTDEVFLEEQCILLDETMVSKEDALERMCARAAALDLVTDEAEFLAAIHRREEVQSTGIGNGVAFPHVHDRAVTRPFVLLARCAKPIEFDSIDGKPVSLVFMLGYPADSKSHLPALSWLSRVIQNEDARRTLAEAQDTATVVATLKRDA